MTLKDMLIKHEGLRLSPYRDSVGKLTLGVGHNLSDKPISHNTAMTMLDDDIADAMRDCQTFSWYAGLDPVRKDVIVDMVFNMGLERYKGFRMMQLALMKADYANAADEMLNSLWAKQVGLRATELSQMMRTGNYS